MIMRSTNMFMLLAFVLLLATGSGSGVRAQCGDINADGACDIGDITRFVEYLVLEQGGPPSNFNQSEADDCYLLTTRDFLVVLNYLFKAGPWPTCPPTQPRIFAPPDPTTLVQINPLAILPANETVVSVTLELTTNYPISAFVGPIQFRFDGEPATDLANIVPGPWGSYFLQGGMNNKGNGRLLMWLIATTVTTPVTTDELVTLDVIAASPQPYDRLVTIEYVSMGPVQNGVPVNEPWVIENDAPLTVRQPGIRSDSRIGFYAAPTEADVNQPVFFTGVTIEPFDADDTWEWDFGDGHVGSGRFPIHTYDGTQPGPFTVSLTLTTDAGTFVITRAAYIHLNPVQADFTANPRAGIAPLTVNFTSTATGATQHAWNFGDPASGPNNTSTLANPTHIYSTAGTYNVSYTASNPLTQDTRTYLGFIKVSSVAAPDIEVTTAAPSVVRRGFNKDIHILVRNLGTADASGLMLTYDFAALPTGISYVSANPPPDNLTATTAQWNLPNLTWDPTMYNFDSYDAVVTLHVDPSVANNTYFTTHAEVPAAPGETYLLNNEADETERVVTSIDPNDKSLRPAPCGPSKELWGDELLNYYIQFENKAEATASAYYVYIIDTLDANLNWSTLQIGPSSHPGFLDVDFDPTTGEITWLFDGIELPPNVSPPEGEGFVSYSIQTLPGLPIGTQVSNRAHIRFDYENWIAAPETGPVYFTVSDTDDNSNGILDACESCCTLRGDYIEDGLIKVNDLTALIGYLFRGDAPPACPDHGDVVVDGSIKVSDLTYLIAFLFRSGPPPPPC